MRHLWLAGVLLLASCAKPPVKPVDLSALDRADALVLDGCYDCLVEARDIYTRVGVGRVRPTVVARLFSTELLMALRERELAMPDPSPAIARARAVVPELPPTLEADRYVALVAAMPRGVVGTPRAEATAFRRSTVSFVPKVDGEVDWLATATDVPAPVRQYFSIAIDCAYAARPRGTRPMSRVAAGRPTLPEGAPPLLRYLVNADCLGTQIPPLVAIREGNPRFVEPALFIGRGAIRDEANSGKGQAREALTAVYARFPTSASATYLLGNLNQTMGDCREALRFYDETVALTRLHEDALLGRTICLTHLKRTDEAMAAATLLVTEKLDNIDQGYYWRAWNEYYVLKQLEAARTDIDAAKKIRSTGETHTLAGIIEHDQDALDESERDLKIARSMAYGNRNCLAAWYLGLVQMKRRAWVPSGQFFQTAMSCYEVNVAEAEAGLKVMREKEDLDAAFRARQIANFEAVIKDDQGQQHSAAFNAANYFATGGEFARARTMLAIAENWPELAEKVALLQAFLKDKP